MGTVQPDNSPSNTSQMFTMKTLVVIAAVLLSCTAAPQYGPTPTSPQSTTAIPQVEPYSQPKTLPANQESPPAAPRYNPSQSQPQRFPARGSGPVQCDTVVATIWDTKYTETEENVCNTEYEEECSTAYTRECEATTRQECDTVQERQCSTTNRQECHTQYNTVYDDYTETDCTVVYQEDCQYHWEGEGNEKVWVVDPGTCTNNPVENCEDVKKQKERQVPHRVCEDIPEERCEYVPRGICTEVPHEVCVNQPYRRCEQVPRERCEVIHKKIPTRISRRINKRVCNTGDLVTKSDKLEVEDDVSPRSSAVVFGDK